MNKLKLAARQLLKKPGFTVVAVLTLAIGIGATTAIFSFVNAILLRPLPYKDPEGLVMVFENQLTNGWTKMTVGAPVLNEWRERSTTFEGLAGRGSSSFILTGNGQPEDIQGSLLSANSFSLIGLKPFLGRDFLPEDEVFGNHRVVLLSYELWQRRFGGDRSLIGRNITLNAEPYLVIGVMPPRMVFPGPRFKLWTPLAFSPTQLAQRHAHNYFIYGRLKSGVTLQQARADMDVVAAGMAEADARNRGFGAEVHLLHDIVVGDSRRILLLFLGAVGFVLLIVCANITNLFLVRSAARNREFAIRAALGAGRKAMISQLLTESLLLAVVGGLVGIFVAWFGIQVFLRASPSNLPRLSEGVPLDPMVLGFTTLITVITGLLFGLLPSLQASNLSLVRDFNETSRGNSVGRRQSFRAILVVSQVAVSLALLICAGLMIRSFGRLVSQNLGYNPEHLISYGVTLPTVRYPNHGDRTRFFEEFLARVRSVPGVESAAWVLGLPLGGQNSILSVSVLDEQPSVAGEAESAGYSQVSSGYFGAVGIPVLKGRDFSERDRTNSLPVAIVNATFVRNFKLGTNVLGRRIAIGDGTESAEIVGLVRDIKRLDMAEEPRGEMYRPYKQMCWGSMSLVVKTQRQPADLTRAIRAELDRIDKDQPLENVRTMTQLVSASVADRRLSMQLMAGFAVTALLLASLGLYGVLAYNVSQRAQEIGIRMALGAQQRNVLALILSQGLKMVAGGLAVGLMLALAMTRVMRALLYEVKPTDPLTYGAVMVILAIVSILACWFPAKRAAKVDPMNTLRSE